MGTWGLISLSLLILYVFEVSYSKNRWGINKCCSLMSNKQNCKMKTYAMWKSELLNYILLIPYMFHQKPLPPRKDSCQFIIYRPSCEMRSDSGLPGSLPCDPGARWDFSCLKKKRNKRKKSTMNKKIHSKGAVLQCHQVSAENQILRIKCPSPLTLIDNCLDKVSN